MTRQLLVCDLDNTLYDWVGYFVPSFYAMVDEAVRTTGCDRERLLDEFRAVHQKHHDSEHPFALLETATIQERYAGLTRQQMAEQLNSAFHAFNSSRTQSLKLYPGVRETLDVLSSSGYVLVAHTEARLYAAVDRLIRLELTDFFRKIYCRERPKSEHPNPTVGRTWLSKFPMHKVRELSHHQRKPDAEVLTEICSLEGIPLTSAFYVGDSITRDVMMAKRAGASSIWAKYGTRHSASYEKLVRITHWTENDVHREQELVRDASDIRPDYVLEDSFSEILNILTPMRPIIGALSP